MNFRLYLNNNVQKPNTKKDTKTTVNNKTDHKSN